MAPVYRKTPKGLSEVETRAHRLPPRVRAALILVDGRRDADALAQLVGAQAATLLQTLAEQGFIEAPASAASAAAPPAALPPSSPASAAPAAPAAPAASAVDFRQLQRDAVRALTDLVGPVAEPLAIRMERARDLAELRPLLATAKAMIENTRGRERAADYGARFGA